MQRKQLSYTSRLFLKKEWLFLYFFFLVPVLLSCSGGGDVLAGGGIGGTGNTSVGPITALGSIFVNGIEFQTTNAKVTMNGVTSDEKALQVGMVVKVEGTVNGDGKTGKADVVTFGLNAAGPISSIDLGKGTLEIMGQTVMVDGQTIIAIQAGTSGLNDLLAGDMVEISGLADADGNIRATRINLKAAVSRSQVSGRISSLTNATFSINALVVDYSKAVLSKFGSAGIQPGDMVDVTGNITSPTTFVADFIEKKSSDGRESNMGKFQGFIDTIYYTGQSVSGFAIITPFGLQRVALDASTIFSDGALIKVGARVQVEGTIQNNIIQAKKLEFMESGGMKGGGTMMVNSARD